MTAFTGESVQRQHRERIRTSGYAPTVRLTSRLTQKIAGAIALLVCSALSSCSNSPVEPDVCAAGPPGLRAAAETNAIEVGTAYRSEYAKQQHCFENVAVREFGALIPEIATFPNRIAAIPGRYDFAEADEICALAAKHDMTCQGHSLIWDPVDHPEWGIVPEWIRDQPPAQRRRTMMDMITATVNHFRGRVDAYTLVNEAFDGAGELTDSAWNTTGDDSYIFDAYRAARRADPKVPLYYNDWGGEDINPKSNAMFDLAKRLRAEKVEVEVDGTLRKVPLIDGVGFQMHVGLGSGQAPEPADVAANIARYERAGLDVWFTEMDVRLSIDQSGRPTTTDLERQATMYYDLIRTCVDALNCHRVTFWGFTDAHSWITENRLSFPGLGAAHPYDKQYLPKPAYEAIRDAVSSPPA